MMSIVRVMTAWSRRALGKVLDLVQGIPGGTRVRLTKKCFLQRLVGHHGERSFKPHPPPPEKSAKRGGRRLVRREIESEQRGHRPLFRDQDTSSRSLLGL